MNDLQEMLPRLPLPSLKDTCEKYIRIVAPFLNKKEIAHTKSIVQDFLDGPGPGLQEQLKILGRSSKFGWLAEFWKEMYLEVRQPLPLNVNIGYTLQLEPKDRKIPQSRIAARLIASSLNFLQMLKNDQLEPDRHGDIPLCMSQYANLFSAARLPGIKIDKFINYPLAKHIVVISRNRFYCFNLFHLNNDPLTEKEIEEGLNQILENSISLPPDNKNHCPVGVLTAEHRTKWAVLRSYIASYDDCNRQSLNLLDTALFVVCLDGAEPVRIADLSENMLCGDGKNRWFDKPLELIVCANGKTGINMEHTGLDGITLIRYISHLYEDIDSRPYSSEQNAFRSTAFTPPEPLRWNFPPAVVEAIKFAESNIEKLILDTETRVLEFNEFGKRSVRKHELSPDALVQMAFQLAYFLHHGEFAFTYEASHTRRFRYGRTEAVRSVTPASIAFVKAFVSNANDKTRLNYLREAVRRHVALVKDAMNGKGSDRHIFALQILSKQQGCEHDLFKDKAYAQIFTRSVLCTTSLKSIPALHLVAFGPVVPEGYGVGYLINDESMTFNVTCRHREAQRFVDLIEKSLLDLHSLLTNECR